MYFIPTKLDFEKLFNNKVIENTKADKDKIIYLCDLLYRLEEYDSGQEIDEKIEKEAMGSYEYYEMIDCDALFEPEQSNNEKIKSTPKIRYIGLSSGIIQDKIGINYKKYIQLLLDNYI